mgnify:FL=1
MPAARGLGLSFYFCHAAHVAEVAEVSVDENKKLTVHKVTVVADVGPIVNMSGALNQVQGAVIDGLSTMVGQKITMENGIIEQTNLHQYPVLRIGAAPKIEVHFIQSDNEPTGLGEPGLPLLAPAVANAIFAGIGKRVRKMPLVDEGFTVEQLLVASKHRLTFFNKRGNTFFGILGVTAGSLCIGFEFKRFSQGRIHASV